MGGELPMVEIEIWRFYAIVLFDLGDEHRPEHRAHHPSWQEPGAGRPASPARRTDVPGATQEQIEQAQARPPYGWQRSDHHALAAATGSAQRHHPDAHLTRTRRGMSAHPAFGERRIFM